MSNNAESGIKSACCIEITIIVKLVKIYELYNINWRVSATYNNIIYSRLFGKICVRNVSEVPDNDRHVGACAQA